MALAVGSPGGGRHHDLAAYDKLREGHAAMARTRGGLNHGLRPGWCIRRRCGGAVLKDDRMESYLKVLSGLIEGRWCVAGRVARDTQCRNLGVNCE